MTESLTSPDECDKMTSHSTCTCGPSGQCAGSNDSSSIAFPWIGVKKKLKISAGIKISPIFRIIK